MYKITIQTLTGNEKTLYYPGDENYVVSSAVLSLKVGSAGEFNFTVPQGNPLYDEIVDHAIITIYEDGAEIWRGDIQDISQNFDKSLQIYALEDLAWLGDETVAMTAIENQTYAQRFNAAMAAYNAEQPIKRQFQPGQITSVITSNTCHWLPQYEENLLNCIRRCIADDGYLKVRRTYETNTGGLTITFDSRTDTEASYDFIDIYYEQDGSYYKRALSGSIGALSVYIPTPTFWIHWHSDHSVNKWGWKIASIVPTYSGTPVDFGVTNLPTADWIVISNMSNLPESEHSYGNNENAYYNFQISQNVLVRYIDILKLEDYGQQASQAIEFGSNLLDFVKEMDNTNFLNVLYPYGAETEEELYDDVMKRIVGTPIQNDASVAAFGRHARSVVFETQSTANLERLALAYLNRYSQPSMKIKAKAVDLGNIEAVARMHIGDSVRVIAKPFAVDQWDYITNQDLDLLNLANNQIELSDALRVTTLTSQVATQIEEIKDAPIPMAVLDAAKKSAFAILEGDNGGIVTFNVNADNQIIELIIANNLDLDQATKAWRWNLNGLAYMHRTYTSDPWTVGIAATMDGGFVADYITTGQLNAAIVDVINLNANNITAGHISASRIGAGILEIGGIDYADNAELRIKDASGNVTGAWNKDGFSANKGSFGRLQIDSSDSSMYVQGHSQFYRSTTRTTITTTSAEVNSKIPSYVTSFSIKTTFTGTVASGQSYADGTQAGTVNIQRSSGGSYSTVETLAIKFNEEVESELTISASDLQNYNYRVVISLNNVSTYLSSCVRSVVSSNYKIFNINETGVRGNLEGAFNGKAVLSDLDIGATVHFDEGNEKLYFGSTANNYAAIDKYGFGISHSISDTYDLWGAYMLNNAPVPSIGTDSDCFFVGGYKSSSVGRYHVMSERYLRYVYNGNTYDYQRSSSDERTKNDIKDLPVELSVGLIDETQPKSFRYNGDEELKHYGMIAQDARAILDELGEDDAGLEYSMGDTNIPDQRNIVYQEYIPHLINYVKDLRAEIEALKEEVRLLKEEK